MEPALAVGFGLAAVAGTKSRLELQAACSGWNGVELAQDYEIEPLFQRFAGVACIAERLCAWFDLHFDGLREAAAHKLGGTWVHWLLALQVQAQAKWRSGFA